MQTALRFYRYRPVTLSGLSRISSGVPVATVAVGSAGPVNAALLAVQILGTADPALRALAACEYLLENCSYTESGQNDIYSALILGEANSEGMALAYVELCRQLDIPCQIVYGQRNWRSHCWNIIQLGGDSYHVDVSVCAEQGLESGFLLPDETMWGHYRWDISSYPPCRGKLSYTALIPPAPEEGVETEQEEEPTDVEPLP